jgi:hypothetical protein
LEVIMIARFSTLTTLTALSCALLLSACGGQDPSETPDPNAVQAASDVSECGGFNTRSKSNAGAPAPTPYCDAEALRWSYDAIAGTLVLSDDRVLLNCCGDHTVKVSEQNGVFKVHQKDEPMGSAGGARCGCMCVFDYKTKLTGVSGKSIDIEIVREVTDVAGGAQAVWSGTLDLTKSSGEILIDKTDVGPWCEK